MLYFQYLHAPALLGVRDLPQGDPKHLSWLTDLAGMSAAQQRNWFLAATLGLTALLAVLGSPSTTNARNNPPVVKKVKAKANPSPQPIVLEGRVIPAVAAAIPVSTDKLQLVAKLNEPVAAGAVVGTTPADPGSVTSVAVRAPVRGILVQAEQGRLGIAPDPGILSAHTTVTAGDLANVHEGQRAQVTMQPNTVLQGTVTHIGQVDGVSGLFPVEIAIHGNRGRLFSPVPASIRLLRD